MPTDMRNKCTGASGEIGGYYGLALPDRGDPFPGTVKYQSGRAALRAALDAAGIRRVMLPAYICGCVPRSLVDNNVTIETYFLDDSLYPMELPETLPDDCAFLYVNYFGLCQDNVDRLLRDIPSNQLIIDNSQALFAPPAAVLANIYSVRKFLGVPDGGLLASTGLDVKVPEYEDTGSIERMRHLLLRMAYSARDGYPDYLESEKSLNNAKPLRMSRLTMRLLASVDMEAVKEQRRRNFLTLAAKLDKHNNQRWNHGTDSVPLCYPLVVDRDVGHVRQRLADRDIFIPTYWPDAKDNTLHTGIEHRLTHCCLAVPCDQRYSHDQIADLGDVIASTLDDNK